MHVVVDPTQIQLFMSAYKKDTKKVRREVGAGGTVHSFSDEERKGFVDYINSTLKDDPDLSHTLPIDSDNLFVAISKGVILWCLHISSFSYYHSIYP